MLRMVGSSPDLRNEDWLVNGAIATEDDSMRLIFGPLIGGCTRLFTEEEAKYGSDGHGVYGDVFKRVDVLDEDDIQL